MRACVRVCVCVCLRVCVCVCFFYYVSTCNDCVLMVSVKFSGRHVLRPLEACLETMLRAGAPVNAANKSTGV